MVNWKAVFEQLKTSNQKFTVYLRYVQKDSLAKVPNVWVYEVNEDHVMLQNQAGFGVVGYEDILYISIPKAQGY